MPTIRSLATDDVGLSSPLEHITNNIITENEEQIINTIRSRCQILRFQLLSENDIQDALKENFSESQLLFDSPKEYHSDYSQFQSIKPAFVVKVNSAAEIQTLLAQ